MMLAKRQQPLATRKCTTKRDLLAPAAICDAANQRLARGGTFTQQGPRYIWVRVRIEGHAKRDFFGSLFVDFWFQHVSTTKVLGIPF